MTAAAESIGEGLEAAFCEVLFKQQLAEN